MKIRSITCFINPSKSDSRSVLVMLGSFLQQVLEGLNTAGYQVQSNRLATIPFPKYIKANKPAEATLVMKELITLTEQSGFQYLSIGACYPDTPKHYTIIPELLKIDNRIFASGSMTTRDGKISLPAIRSCAEVIHAAAQITPDGFANLRFAALANVKPYAPFFPAAYADGNNPAVSLAIEGADLAVSAFKAGTTLEDGQKKLREMLNEHGKRLESIIQPLCRKNKVEFKGLDFSLAPYPTSECSIATAIEGLGVTKAGLSGSVAAAALIASTLDQGRWKKIGFNGLMLPVLEDSVLAKRVADGDLTLKDFLLFSCVCGTGLDTIPLAGDISIDQLTAILTDVAALAVRLQKPLTARLMPVPGKNVGDQTDFTFEYFANSRIMNIQSIGLTGALSNSKELPIQPR